MGAHILQRYLKRYYDVDFDIEKFYNEHKDRQKIFARIYKANTQSIRKTV